MQQRLETCIKQVPLLLVPEEKVKKWWNFKKNQRRLYTVSGRKLPKFKLSLPLKVRSCGSSHGWLAFCTGSSERCITLYNPFSSTMITDLPIISKMDIPILPEFFIQKLILSANPFVSSDFYIVIIYGHMHKLALMRYKQKSWTYIGGSADMITVHFIFADVIFHKGLLYAVDGFGNIESLDIIRILNKDTNKEPHPICKLKVSPMRRIYMGSCIVDNLVESSCGDLLMVRRMFTDDDYDCQSSTKTTVGFEVFKVIILGGNNRSNNCTMGKMVELKSLGGDSLFVGDNHSSSVAASASYFSGCQPDSIYFTDHFLSFNTLGCKERLACDVGVYNMKNGSIERHYQPLNKTINYVQPPIWITPTPFL